MHAVVRSSSAVREDLLVRRCGNWVTTTMVFSKGVRTAKGDTRMKNGILPLTIVTALLMIVAAGR
ncbi:MAG: hypothetical protein ACRDJW_02425, partial [Thermomicrobiales bacterium]